MTPTAFALDAIYEVTWNKNAETLTVNVCMLDKPAMLLSNYDRELSPALMFATQAPQNGSPSIDVKQGRNKIQFKPEISNCLDYVVSLKPKDSYPYLLEQDNLVIPTHLWLWRHPDISQARFRFSDVAGKLLNFYLPFPKHADWWVLSVTPPHWTSRTLIGNVNSYPITLSQNKHLNAVLLGSLNDSPKRWIGWLHKTAAAIETAFGYYPIDQANILVIPSKSRHSPVPWGEVQRGGYPAVHFFIDPAKSQQTFEQDWTASHEMSHLFVPKTLWRDRWLSEGIASYYQNVLRARGGILSKDEAWQKLREGFARGRRDFNHRSLRNVNQTMHLYWGGVAIYFLADLRLREQDSSLEMVLQRFNECCFTLDKIWSTEELMAKFDELSETRIFTGLLKNEADEKQFPISTSFENSSNPLINKHLGNILSGKLP